MNVARVLRGSQMTEQDEEKRFVIRLKEEDNTNDRLERRIIELADGSSVAGILCRLTEGLDQVWTAWIERRMSGAMQKLQQRGFIRIERRPRA